MPCQAKAVQCRCKTCKSCSLGFCIIEVAADRAVHRYVFWNKIYFGSVALLVFHLSPHNHNWAIHPRRAGMEPHGHNKQDKRVHLKGWRVRRDSHLVAGQLMQDQTCLAHPFHLSSVSLSSSPLHQLCPFCLHCSLRSYVFLTFLPMTHLGHPHKIYLFLLEFPPLFYVFKIILRLYHSPFPFLPYKSSHSPPLPSSKFMASFFHWLLSHACVWTHTYS